MSNKCRRGLGSPRACFLFFVDQVRIGIEAGGENKGGEKTRFLFLYFSLTRFAILANETKKMGSAVDGWRTDY